MRTPNSLVAAYSDASFPASNRKNFYVRRDICLVDLCLHFLSTYMPSESVWVVPSLLQGHLVRDLPKETRKALFIMRQYANGFCSRLAWRSALNEHSQYSNTAYLVQDDVARKRDGVSDVVISELSNSLQSTAPYPMRVLKFGQRGTAVFRNRAFGREFTVDLPAEKGTVAELAQLRRREVNPPISIRWDTLLAIAKDVDAREKAHDFPQWLPKLNLEQRIKKVKITALGSEFYRDDTLILDGTQHMVGMLSSGKSTLVQALLFALISPGYDKRVLVLSKDTAAASELIARLKAHGIKNSTVISSINNRDVHLSAALWNTQSYSSDQTFEAAAALTESLGTACPLDGYQSNEKSFSRENPRKPCFNLIQEKKGGEEQEVACPLIAACPTHKQQRMLSSASVIAMTPQAFIKMTPEKYALSEELSFPEAMQFFADVVLIDEADEVLRTFDEQCTQQQGLLSSDGRAFTLTSTRALASSLGDRGGSQYAKLSNVQWHRQFNKLQDSIGAIYHLFLKHRDKFSWIISQKTFTSASILTSLWRHGAGYEESANGNASAKSQAIDKLELLAALSGALYNSLSMPGNRQPIKSRFESINADPKLQDAFSFLADIQVNIIEATPALESDNVFKQIMEALACGPLEVFSSNDAASDSDQQVPKKTEERFSQRRRVNVPDDNFSRALAITLALLTNNCLSSFSYLVRNQAAVEDDFGLTETDVFREARRIMRHYGGIIPRPLLGSTFGLMFEPSGENSEDGGTLRLINHLALGRFLLTNMDKLLAEEGQAGPHVLLLSGTSWAGGASPSASPLFDVQWPVSAILEQPEKEREALSTSMCEFVSLGPVPISVSGQPPEVRRENLKRIASLLTKSGVSGTPIERKWSQLIESDKDDIGKYSLRQRALLVTNNYDDAKLVANTLAQANPKKHTVYCLVSDTLARSGEAANDAKRTGEAFHRDIQILPRSQVESFGEAPPGSILVTPLHPISRGHNIVIPGSGFAAISTIYFLHRPHPRPDDLASVIGAINRFAMDVVLGHTKPEGNDIEEKSEWFRRKAQCALDEGFALRTAYAQMPKLARTQYSWDLITSIWQTIGRGIRGGVPVYVGFVDERFAPGIYKSPAVADTVYSSCLKQCEKTLENAINGDGIDQKIAKTLYQPFRDMLNKLFDANESQKEKK
ncbi:hypothetical protein [Undibacterium sp. TJN19]|uniref:pPIWI_RE_Z domain-containing protein n=1 Tax=Undibacterium sp. TJN19 TaxID=3413055 RepID=UPI003BF443F9